MQGSYLDTNTHTHPASDLALQVSRLNCGCWGLLLLPEHVAASVTQQRRLGCGGMDDNKAKWVARDKNALLFAIFILGEQFPEIC